MDTVIYAKRSSNLLLSRWGSVRIKLNSTSFYASWYCGRRNRSKYFLCEINYSNNCCSKITWKLASKIVTHKTLKCIKTASGITSQALPLQGTRTRAYLESQSETCQTFHERITIYKRRRNFPISANTFSRFPPTQFPNMLKPPKNNTRFPAQENKQT